jgi:hypothetical protein
VALIQQLRAREAPVGHQAYGPDVHAPDPRLAALGQTRAAFLRNHGRHIWACDFLQTFDLFSQLVFSFFIVELSSRRAVRVGVTRQPNDAWVAQQLREATPFGQRPKYLIRDHDSKFGPAFAQVAEASGIKEMHIAYGHRG